VDEYEASLYDALLTLKTRDECQQFLQDVLSNKELTHLVTRWKAFCALLDGATHRAVSQKFEIPISTVSRAAHTLQCGTGACKLLFKRLREKKSDKKIPE
jgi:TrpR-related protein YerC/YecD